MARGTKKKPLSEMKRRFVDAYMGKCLGNGKQAAIAAGYSPKTAKNQGSRLLTLVDVRQAIETRVRADPAVADVKEVQAYLTAVMRGRGAYALSKDSDRLRAAELLVRTHGGFRDKHFIGASGDLLELLGQMPLPPGG